jgi:predicted glycoside hydrolase/deacetylase ChbG (UPF0249 family)
MKHKISEMGNEHTEWLSALSFYKQELNTLKDRLTEIAGKNTATEMASQVEHFENQFKMQAEHIDILTHNINKNLTISAIEAQANTAGYIDESLLKKHAEQKEAFGTLEKVLKDLRAEFNTFAAKWM